MRRGDTHRRKHGHIKRIGVIKVELAREGALYLFGRVPFVE